MEDRIIAVLFSEPNTTNFKKISGAKPIYKSEFEEKSFYPSVPSEHVKVLKKNKNGKPALTTPKSTLANKPLEDIHKDKFTGFEQRSHYIEIEKNKVSNLFFSDGSLYKVGVGFIQNASKEMEKKVKELLESAE